MWRSMSKKERSETFTSTRWPDWSAYVEDGYLWVIHPPTTKPVNMGPLCEWSGDAGAMGELEAMARPYHSQLLRMTEARHMLEVMERKHGP